MLVTRIGLLVLISLASRLLMAQTSTQDDGLWTSATVWNTGVPPDVNTNGITISHEVTVPSGTHITIDQTTINSGGALIIEAGASVTVSNGSADDLVLSGTAIMNVSGTLICNNLATITGTTAANTNFLDGSVYQNLYTTQQGVIPLATWHPNSTLRVSGYTVGPSISSSAWSQNFGNVTFDFPGSANGPITLNLTGLLKSIAGDVTIATTNSVLVALNLFPQSFALSIGGNLMVGGNSRVQLNNTAVGTTVNIGGDFIYNTANTDISPLNGTGTCTVNIEGDLIINPSGQGTLRLAGSASSLGVYNIKGNFIFNAGTILGGTSPARTEINFNGSTPQTFFRSASGTTLLQSQNVDYIVETGSVLNLPGNSILSGGGQLVVRGSLGLGSTDTGGPVQNNTTENPGFGNIRVPLANRIFESGSTVIYNGTNAQEMSNYHPSSAGVATVINNATGVTVIDDNVTTGGDVTVLTGNLNMTGTSPKLTIDGDLILSGGDLNVGANSSLVLNGDIIPNGNFVTATPTSDLAINGSGSFGVFPFPEGPQQIRSFSLDRDNGSVTFQDDLTIDDATNLSNGVLSFEADLTLNGTFISTSGALAAGASSSLTIGGSGSMGTLVFAAGGNSLVNLSMNRSGSALLGSAITVADSLNLVNGSLGNGTGITIEDGVVVTRNSSAHLLVNGLSLAPGDSYDIVYNGSGAATTGLELPLPSDENSLRNLTIDGGEFTLTQDITINGDVNLLSGSLNGDQSSITMRGANWLDGSGNYIPGTSQIIFTGNTVVTGTTPQFGGVQVTGGASVTLPNGNTSIAGDIDVAETGIFPIADKTITLNGDGVQSISLQDAFLANLTIDKTGGNVQLITPLNLTGLLLIESATEFNSSGLLTLISTSDQASGNASVGPILNGGSVVGDVVVQRYMSGEGRIYRYLSSPVSNATVADWQEDFPITGTFSDPSTGDGIRSNNPSMYYYDETAVGGIDDGWMPYPTSDLASENALKPGRGYSAFIRKDIASTTWDVVGTINQGSVDLSVTYHDTGSPEADGWNLVGNPYPSTIEWGAPSGWTQQNIDASVWIRDNGAGVFLTSDGAGVGDIPGGRIASGQAFWIKANGDNPELQISEEAKSTSTASFFRSAPQEIDYLEISVSREDSYVDRSYFRQRDGAMEGLDRFDAPKMENDYYSLAVLSESMGMAISAVGEMPCDPTVPLLLTFKKNQTGAFVKNPAGTYKLDVKGFGFFDGSSVLVVDKYLNTTTPLNGGPFSFTIDNSPLSYASDRFELRVVERIPDLALAISGNETLCNDEDYRVVLNHSEPRVEYSLFINGESTSKTLTGTGGDLPFVVAASSLVHGKNTISFRARKLCTYDLENTFTVTKDRVYQITSTSSPTICQEGSTQLIATGAPEGAFYNWYEDDVSERPIAHQRSGIFETPVISRSQTFYVAIENSLGCEGNRVPVPIFVKQYTDITITPVATNILASSYANGNVWFLNGRKIAEDSQEIQIKESGVYRVEVNLDGCITSSEYNFVLTGTEDSDTPAFSVYPNPTRNIVHVAFKNGVPADQVIVINANGQVVSPKALGSAPDGTYAIDVADLPSGVYQVVIRYGGRRYMTRLIKL